MSPLVRRLVIAAVLMAALAPAALAGGPNAKVSGPMKDGKYFVHTYACSDPAALKVTAWAEGLVNGKRRTVPIKIQKTPEIGVYMFARTWPESGTWAIRMALGSQGSHAPVTITALDEHGVVKANKLIWDSDGTKECVAILQGDDGC